MNRGKKILKGFGVSAWQHAMVFFFKGQKKLGVVGGGNAAVEEAMFLTKFATKNTINSLEENSLRAEKNASKKKFKGK
ncbi:MAG: hypothetical protein Ct9H300mP5_2330 [Candidatus Pelagibacterales bacterium]|nr:MAG: hypothetical protein Ct9H300mP5_2330 [Pelagibacterales bacterium]